MSILNLLRSSQRQFQRHIPMCISRQSNPSRTSVTTTFVAKFCRKLHSFYRRNDFQQDNVRELQSDLDEIIGEVESSVNKSSGLDTIEDAFICLKQFADEMPVVRRILYEDLIHDGHVVDSISHSMVEVGTLLRDKGGPKGKVNAIRQEIEGYDFDGTEFFLLGFQLRIP